MINIIDTNVYSILISLLSLQTTLIMKFISHLGSATILIMLVIALFIILKDKKISLAISLNLIIVYLLNVLIKNIIERPRPEVLRLAYETGYSFPSGHAMVSTGFYGFLIYISYKRIKNKAVRNIVIALLSLLILLIGTSRIYLGVHYATDILGGFIIGTIYLLIFIKIIKGVRLWKTSLQ